MHSVAKADARYPGGPYRCCMCRIFLWNIHRLTWLTMCLTMSLQATSYGSSGYEKLMKKVKIE